MNVVDGMACCVIPNAKLYFHHSSSGLPPNPPSGSGAAYEDDGLTDAERAILADIDPA